jgi:alpha-L-fucosidase
MQEFRDAKFGMFIHWGPVSIKGTEIGWSRGRQVPIEEYDQLYTQFNPVNFDADAWVLLAKDAGMKYLVITSKHHDGFSLWDSEYTDYDIMNTPFARDVLRELSDACKRHGIQFSVYYSLADWYHPDYPLGSPGGQTEKAQPNMPRYVEFVRNQTRELIDNYGPLGVMWFDGEWEEPWTREYGNDLYAYLKDLQPSLLINNRVSKGRQGMSGTTLQTDLNAGDFDTPEQEIGRFNNERPWESCITLCRQWAWKPDDEMKSLKESLHTLVGSVVGDGNLLLNVGPMPDGRIEPRQAARLREMGAWLQEYGQSIYGTRGGPWRTEPWGGSTHRGETIYLHVLEWPADTLVLPALSQRITDARLLTAEGEVSWIQDDETVRVFVTQAQRDSIDTLIELTVEGPV